MEIVNTVYQLGRVWQQTNVITLGKNTMPYKKLTSEIFIITVSSEDY